MCRSVKQFPDSGQDTKRFNLKSIFFSDEIKLVITTSPA